VVDAVNGHGSWDAIHEKAPMFLREFAHNSIGGMIGGHAYHDGLGRKHHQRTIELISKVRQRGPGAEAKIVGPNLHDGSDWLGSCQDWPY
jgi:hypothetical protein